MACRMRFFDQLLCELLEEPLNLKKEVLVAVYAMEFTQNRVDFNSVALCTLRTGGNARFEGFRRNQLHKVQQNDFFEQKEVFLLHILQ